jgi:CTD kinase subunit gamma
LENWRSKRVIDPQKVDDVMSDLSTRNASLDVPMDDAPTVSTAHRSAPPINSFSRSDIFKRIEEDRERHKRLRERRWVQPISHNLSTYLPAQLTSFMPLTDEGDGDEELTIDIEFDNEWETTSDWNEDDDDAAREEIELCFPSEGEGPMDLS